MVGNVGKEKDANAKRDTREKIVQYRYVGVGAIMAGSVLHQISVLVGRTIEEEDARKLSANQNAKMVDRVYFQTFASARQGFMGPTARSISVREDAKMVVSV